MRWPILIFLSLFLLGCVNLGDQKDCKTDKKCLLDAFAKCEEKHGVWEGKNGNINVSIIGKKENRCGVVV